MKVLVLSCSTGEGHNTAGNAVIECMRSKGITADMVNALELMNVNRSKVVCNTYIKIVNETPELFGWLYNAGLKLTTDKFKSIVYYANKASQNKLYNYIVDNGYDTVVLTHLFPAETITSLKHGRKEINFKCYAVSTDYTCIPFWEDIETDGIITAHKSLIEESVSRGIDRKILLPLGIPVSLKFNKKYDRKAAREQIGLGDADKIYLIMTGSMGFGNTDDIVNPLLCNISDNDRVVVLGGRNEALKSTLREKYKGNKKLCVCDYTKQVELYMASCDVLFSKPGGLSSSEAATMGVPLIHTAPIPGVETRNADLFSKLGLSIYEKDTALMVKKAMELAHDEKAQKEMIARQHKEINANAANDICDYIISHADD